VIELNYIINDKFDKSLYEMTTIPIFSYAKWFYYTCNKPSHVLHLNVFLETALLLKGFLFWTWFLFFILRIFIGHSQSRKHVDKLTPFCL